LLNTLDQELTYDNLVVRKRSALEKAETEPEERTVMVLKLTEGLRLTEAGIKVSEDSDGNGQQAGTTRQGVVRMRACCKEILKEKKGSLCLHASTPNSFRLSAGTCALPPVLFNTSCEDPDDLPTVQEEVPAD
jgi:hypothetical protein